MDGTNRFPCPNCDEVFDDIDDLNNHALNEHTLQQLSKIIGEHMHKTVTKDDFVQVDSQWVYAYHGFQFSLSQDSSGAFKLTVFGSLEGIPPATQYPTQPEWDTAEQLTNKFISAYDTALHDDKRN